MDKRLIDKSWRIKHLYKIRDKERNLIKFKRNKAQQHFNENKWYRNIILKSRQLGFTTDESIDSLDDVLFTRNTECLLIAHNLDAGKKIFDGKIELAWKNIPEGLRALYKVDANTAQALKFEFGDGTYSSIAVDTTGRSGTYNRVHITEFADICKKFPNKVKDILEGTIPAIPTYGRIDIESTSQGASGEFHDMFMNAWGIEPKYPEQYKAHFYNWTWDEEIPTITPETNLPDKFKEYQLRHHLTDEQITYYYKKWLSLNKDWNSLHKEYPTTPEEAFEVIIEGSYYGEEIGMMERDGRMGIVPHDKALKVHTVWDLGIGENMVIGFFQRTKEGQIRMIDYWQGQGSDGMPEAIRAVFSKGSYIYGYHFGPHDLDSTDVSTGKTRKDTARQLGISFRTAPDQSIEDGINAGQITLSKLFVDKENCKEWIKSMKNYCHEWDDKRGMYKNEPLHNWASHGADMWRYASLVADRMINDMISVNSGQFYDKNIEIWNG